MTSKFVPVSLLWMFMALLAFGSTTPPSLKSCAELENQLRSQITALAQVPVLTQIQNELISAQKLPEIQKVIHELTLLPNRGQEGYSEEKTLSLQNQYVRAYEKLLAQKHQRLAGIQFHFDRVKDSPRSPKLALTAQTAVEGGALLTEISVVEISTSLHYPGSAKLPLKSKIPLNAVTFFIYSAQLMPDSEPHPTGLKRDSEVILRTQSGDHLTESTLSQFITESLPAECRKRN